MLATVLHDVGWIDVGVVENVATVQLNPATVSRSALPYLKPALAERAPNRRIELILLDRDTGPVTVHFMNATAACAHVEDLVAVREDVDEREQASSWGPEAQTAPPTDHKTSRVPGARIPVDGSAGLTDEVFTRRLLDAEWLLPGGTHQMLSGRSLAKRQPAMVSFAIRTLGYIAIKRNWRFREFPFATTPPDLIAFDPRAVSEQARRQLLLLFDGWAQSRAEVEIGWWNGEGWIREVGSLDLVFERVRFLCRSVANDEPWHAFDNRVVPFDPKSFGDRWAPDHPFARTLAHWRAERAGGGSAETLIRNLEREGIFQERTKLVVVDENSEVRIARYAPGSFRLWDDATNQSLVGTRLLDVPDKGLGLSVQRDLLEVHRRAEPTLHRCRGIIRGSQSTKMVHWNRLTVPLDPDARGKSDDDLLLSICVLDRSEIVSTS